MNSILNEAARYPRAGGCNNGIVLGPYALYLGVNNLMGKSEWCFGRWCGADFVVVAADGFVTMDISRDVINVEYYARDMEFEVL